jgi:Ser/Thr protein kinase RdoA (MazF antagonist)
MTAPDAWAALRGHPVRPCDDGGLINTTYLVGEPAPVAVLQRVNTGIFKPSVHEDMEAVTAHLAAKGMVTPRLLRTDSGALWATRDDEVWRAMSYVPGRTLHRVESPAVAHAAGALVARFHAALDDLAWAYRHVRAGAHDTVAHMQRLRASMDGAHDGDPGLRAEARALAEAILARWESWEGRLDLPERHIHGDLKISNLRFGLDGVSAVCLLDLETMARGSLDVELGDAWRSWCNPVGEDSTDTRFDLDIFTAAVTGYLAHARPSAEEREAIVGGVERIALELASRFCRDVFEDSYFGWSAARFPSRRAHNLFRARGQLSLAVSVRDQRAAAERAVRG